MPIYAYDSARPVLPPPGRFFLAPDAALIGRVVIEEDASIWFNAVLRGDNEPITVGRRSNVQDGCVLHTDPGFPLVIGPGCTIGENSLVGMGATILNGARIAPNSLVGAGALVTEGKEFPPNSLIVGSPARVARTLGDNAIKMLAAAAQLYVDRWPRYLAGLQRLD
jgi:carbonic anhydrase/acetyltransferase-like protein (isoleucine patch superfamily)